MRNAGLLQCFVGIRHFVYANIGNCSVQKGAEQYSL